MLIGVDLGGTKCAGVVLSDGNAVLAEAVRPTPIGGDAVLATIIEVIDELVAQAAPQAARRADSAPRAVRIGIGVPGLVTPDGVLRFAPHLFGVREVPLRDLLRARLPAGALVVVENDNTAATWGERMAGAACGIDDVLYVGLGTGIGGGIITGGVLQRGHHGFAGEFGHMTVDRDGERCVCGRRGCWELVASGTALSRLAGRAGEGVTAAARSGDAQALDVLDRFAGAVASGLSNLIVTLDPAVVVLGGGVLDPPEPLLELIRKRLSPALGDAGSHRPRPDIRAAALGRRAGAIGAALLARDCGSAAATSGVVALGVGQVGPRRDVGAAEQPS